MDQEGSVERKAAEDTAAARDAPLKLEEFLPYRLNVVASLVSQALSRIYAERYGIGVPEWRVLVTLGQYGMMTGKAIGAHSHMHKTKVSRAVGAAGTAQAPDAASQPRRPARRPSLRSTPAGRAMYEDLAPIALDFAQRLADAIDPADRAAFDRAIDRLTERSAKLAAECAKGRGRRRAVTFRQRSPRGGLHLTWNAA